MRFGMISSLFLPVTQAGTVRRRLLVDFQVTQVTTSLVSDKNVTYHRDKLDPSYHDVLSCSFIRL